MVKVGDKYVLHSKNGMDYNIEVVNINDFREPSMKYGMQNIPVSISKLHESTLIVTAQTAVSIKEGSR